MGYILKSIKKHITLRHESVMRNPITINYLKNHDSFKNNIYDRSQFMVDKTM